MDAGTADSSLEISPRSNGASLGTFLIGSFQVNKEEVAWHTELKRPLIALVVASCRG